MANEISGDLVLIWVSDGYPILYSAPRFSVDSRGAFAHIFRGCFIGTGAINVCFSDSNRTVKNTCQIENQVRTMCIMLGSQWTIHRTVRPGVLYCVLVTVCLPISVASQGLWNNSVTEVSLRTTVNESGLESIDIPDITTAKRSTTRPRIYRPRIHGRKQGVGVLNLFSLIFPFRKYSFCKSTRHILRITFIVYMCLRSCSTCWL